MIGRVIGRSKDYSAYVINVNDVKYEYSADRLKEMVRTGVLELENMELTKDNRLVFVNKCMVYEKGKVSREVKKEEALKRLKIMHVLDIVRNSFIKYDEIPYLTLTDKSSYGLMAQMQKQDRNMLFELEQEYHVLFFCVFKETSTDDYIDDFYCLYIDENTKNWDAEKQRLKDGYANVLHIWRTTFEKMEICIKGENGKFKLYY